jgi:hypothetical protein
MDGGLGNIVVSNSPKVTIMPVMKEIISPRLMKAGLRHIVFERYPLRMQQCVSITTTCGFELNELNGSPFVYTK